MNKNKKKYEDLEEDVQKKVQQREKRKRKKMRVSGKRVFQLQKIIQEKAEKKTDRGPSSDKSDNSAEAEIHR
jgi:hypothetical protein